MKVYVKGKYYTLVSKPTEKEKKIYHAVGVDEKKNKYNIVFNMKKYLFVLESDFEYGTRVYKIKGGIKNEQINEI